MKKIYIIIAIVASLFSACSKDSLKLHNPNEAGIESLKSEEGIQKFALGVYHPMRSNYYAWLALTLHNLMGDATTSHANNFGFRYSNQIFTITRPDGTILRSPLGNETQERVLKRLNIRENGNENAFHNEWMAMYGTLGHCNLALKLLDNNEVVFKDNAEVKKKTYQAWFLWWKAFAYSRIGSLYAKGVITNEYNVLSNNYQSHEAIITEANRLFEEAKAILATIPENDTTYSALIDTFIPSQFKVGNGGIITPQMFIHNINTYMARNLLVNKYASELTTAELSQIETLVNSGIQRGDKIFTIRSVANGDLCFVSETAWTPYRFFIGWENISERLVQDFKTGDNRYTRNIETRSSALFNPRDRGFGIGTRYKLKDGGDYASTTAGVVELPFAGTYEENQLMLAEVKLRKDNDIDGALTLVDAVRTYQNAGLAAVAGTGLTKAQALEELRKERRIGLFLKGTAFYDARRWGILKPVAQGGGRTNANVIVAADGTTEACTIDYQYLEWFDVPASETDFNPLP
jgi:hypothetical protein